jgi:hypothetical protein
MTNYQRKVLRFYLGHRHIDMSLGYIVVKSWPRLAYAVVSCGLAAGYFYWQQGWPWAVPFIALGLGMMASDLAHCRATHKLWPIMRQIVDWSVVERQLASSDVGGKRSNT